MNTDTINNLLLNQETGDNWDAQNEQHIDNLLSKYHIKPCLAVDEACSKWNMAERLREVGQ